jgi:hypothetical protein
MLKKNENRHFAYTMWRCYVEMMFIGFLAPQVWSYISRHKVKWIERTKNASSTSSTVLSFKWFSQRGVDIFIYIRCTEIKVKVKFLILKKEKTGIQLHVLYISYTYELIHVLYMYTLRKEWYFLVNYCSISHLDVENGFIFFR